MFDESRNEEWREIFPLVGCGAGRSQLFRYHIHDGYATNTERVDHAKWRQTERQICRTSDLLSLPARIGGEFPAVAVMLVLEELGVSPVMTINLSLLKRPGIQNSRNDRIVLTNT
jgi:hypothetical protein